MIAEMTTNADDPVRLMLGCLWIIACIVGMCILWSLTGEDNQHRP